MENNNCEKLELIKVYQENLKILTLMILTTGAGIGAVILKQNLNFMLKNSLLITLGAAFLVLSLLAISIYLKVRKLLQEAERKWKY